MFKSISPKNLTENVFYLIANQWMLIAAGEKSSFNCMTASWGGLGQLWNKDVAYIFVRPQRYTYEFLEKYDNFSLNFFESKYKNLLNICGSKSGRDIDKMNLEITPVFDNNTIYYNESKIVIICKKIYYQDIKPDNFIEKSIQKNYPLNDYHRMYIGEILQVLVNESI